MHSKNCRVCGLALLKNPWGEDGKLPSWEICPCCGTEFGYEDRTPASARNQRAKWIESGLKWFDKKRMPSNWSFEEQILNIPPEFI